MHFIGRVVAITRCYGSTQFRQRRSGLSSSAIEIRCRKCIPYSKENADGTLNKIEPVGIGISRPVERRAMTRRHDDGESPVNSQCVSEHTATKRPERFKNLVARAGLISFSKWDTERHKSPAQASRQSAHTATAALYYCMSYTEAIHRRAALLSRRGIRPARMRHARSCR